MNFNIVDTQAAYQRLLAAPDAAARETIFLEELTAPYAGLARIFGGGDSLATFRQWGMSPDQFADGSRAEMSAILDELAAHDAWNRAARALEEGRAAFAAYEEHIPLGLIQFGLFVAELKGLPMQRGYTGFGGIPGYIMTVYGEPDEYNLVRIEGATVHELHHNVRFTLFPFTMQVTLGEYIIAEGLAESFAAELYGEEVVGYYVTDFNDAELEQAKRVIGGALDASGFDVVRGYIFGDALAEHFGLPKAGVPAFAGYAIGYRVVQQYLKRTGKSVAEATFVPAQELITESRFFD
jgi:uncharacterized protein YjaZ